MKKNLRLLALALMLVVCGQLFSASLACKDYVVNKRLYYWSVDANNNPIRLSEMVNYNSVYPEIKCVLISNHPTTTSNALVPTGSDPQIPQVYYMCDGDDKCLVVSPDYLGYGSDSPSSNGEDSYQSRNTTHPYMCGKLTARNVVDGVLAAMDYVVTQKNVKNIFFGESTSKNYYFATNYFTLNVGYSQGGQTTLAVHKYLETEAPQTVKDRIKLKKSICGAGPHLQTYMFDTMETMTTMKYPLYIPYTIDGMKYAFGNSTMRGLKDNEIYTEEFLNSGLLDRLRQKNTVAATLNALINEYFGDNVTFYDMIRPEYKDHNSKLYRTLRKALKQNDLLEGWKPSKPITFYHYKSDEVVPYEESEMAYNYFKNLGCTVDLKESDAVDVTGIWVGSSIIGKPIEDNHMGRGTKFYLSIFCGALR